MMAGNDFLPENEPPEHVKESRLHTPEGGVGSGPPIVLAGLAKVVSQQEKDLDTRTIGQALAILNGNFRSLIIDKQGLFGRPVPPGMVKKMFVQHHGTTRGWDAFCSRSVKLWARFIRKQDHLSESDKYYLGSILFDALEFTP